MISMIAVVGRGGVIGPRDSLPQFADPDVYAALALRARRTTQGGVLVFGSATARMMVAAGTRLDLMDGEGHHAVWSRSHGVSPAEFLDAQSATGRNVFIVGGRTTFRVFAPFCENFFIWRAELLGEDQNILDPILPIWGHREVRVLN